MAPKKDRFQDFAVFLHTYPRTPAYPSVDTDATNPEPSDTDHQEDIVGYLNFSSGASELGFLRHINEQFRAIEGSFPRDKSLGEFTRRLLATIDRLESTGGTFADVTQARAVVQILEHQLLPAYRKFHHDLLFHQTEADLWRPFFIGRACEAILAQGSPWDEHQRIAEGALAQLNDYVGYRPVAMLDSEHLSDPYPHEFVRPIPLYIQGIGVAVGRYEKIIQLALEILAHTDEDILTRAGFDFDLLEEVAVDPRAYDFDHPVNRRPNYHFGQWDPHHISGSGYYTRFVLQQITLDALLSRCEEENCASEKEREECQQDAAAVLAGTMLMAAAISGDGPGRHDSTVTLSTLLPRIASFRDDFYELLLANSAGPRGERLRAEAKQQRQPFGAARQHLNHELARRRSLQMQHVHLAHLYARLGYPEAAQRQADSVQVAAARMVSGIYCHLTSGHDAIDLGTLDQVADHLIACEDLIYRGIECGALVDPWNVVGFAGNFSLFPALENTVHDQRVDGLIELVEQVLDLGARAWSEAAAIDDSDLEKKFSEILVRMATWWDKFATSTVEDVARLVAKETEVSANLVAGALNAWHKAGAAAGDIGFWRMFVDQFDTSKSFQLVIEALLDHGDTIASRALMMQWVSQKDRTPLEENDSSFRRLSFQWLAAIEAEQLACGEDRWDEVEKFFAYLEANAEEYWQVPSLTFDVPFDSIPFDGPSDEGDELDSDLFLEEPFDEDDEEEEDEEDELFEAAYEQMVYRDSTDDGFEGDLADEGMEYEDSEWEHEAHRLEQRLDFLTTVANLWKHAAIVWGSKSEQADHSPEVFVQGLAQTTTNYRQLIELLETIHGYQLPQPSGSHESLVEYDRLRTLHEGLVQRIIITCVETRDAARLLAATHSREDSSEGETFGDPVDLYSVKILRAVLAGDAEAIRGHWPKFVAALKPCALLYLPHSRGGEPRQIVATRGIQQLLHDLLGWLPQLGLIRETCQLLDVAQEMEREHPVGRGAVTEFDGLFESGYQAIVRSMVVSAELWAQSNSSNQANSSNQEQQADHMLVDALQQLTETQLDRWLNHSRSLRLSVVERLGDDRRWKKFTEFVRRYGADLFDQKFMSLGNLRGILHQGVEQWLESLADDPDAEDEFRLIKDINEGLIRDEAAEQLSLAIETVVENYHTYLDYNTTTTQSDHGEQLYTLVDFLRLQAAYERVAWNLKPVVWAHEILVRRNRAAAAEMWCQTFTERTAEEADAHLARLASLSQEYGMRLATVADRIGERFVRPLMIDRVRALVEPALAAVDAESQDVFVALEREIASLAKEPSGAGLDIPDWLAALEDEVTTARSRFNHQAPSDRLANHIGQVQLTWQELLEQLEETP